MGPFTKHIHNQCDQRGVSARYTNTLYSTWSGGAGTGTGISIIFMLSFVSIIKYLDRGALLHSSRRLDRCWI